MYVAGLDLMDTLETSYPLSNTPVENFRSQVNFVTPQVESSTFNIDGVEFWSVPVTYKLTGEFGILCCPPIIESPMDLFYAFKNFRPCIPFAHSDFSGIPQFQEVKLPMLGYNCSKFKDFIKDDIITSV